LLDCIRGRGGRWGLSPRLLLLQLLKLVERFLRETKEFGLFWAPQQAGDKRSFPVGLVSVGSRAAVKAM